ncbi:1,2-diacylglycerol-3-alpha-glucose alpha-1,2-glucosyltransferase [Granulicatella balaenopterae]|uniref:1,2-diacylglycerol-3-alpha-glucose alpha-1,2-glucosyltransferase n=1 Tax=Granulicatella balaenopterae TaxID=137733 RepID=A0A1H9HPY5_9LACT|nr:glycosyltransferase family 4 protein [Granulicatella balaenopterae]SEQ64292.1 1,2-diacylglycerol-3-alpha-glucose alpha-1,2-glucosyltransferase [Granulicatella balaenopterae]
MKVWLDSRFEDIVAKSGIGRALEHQRRALENCSDITLVGPRDAYQLAHFNTVFPSVCWSAIYAKLRRKSVIMHAHSTMEDFENSFIGSNYLAPFFKKWLIFCYTRGDAIITPTEYSKNLLRSYGIKKDIYVLSNGIDLAYYQSSQKVRKKNKIISVGHYIERKGLLDFIEIARMIPQYDFYWYGYTDVALQSAKIRKAIATKPRNVYFPGYVDKEELKRIYDEASLFLFTTYEETEGIVLLEALAMEIPILVRDIPIYKESFPEKEVVYKFRDNKECMWMIQKMMHQEIPSLVKNGYQVAKRFDIDQIGYQLSSIYHKVNQK